MAKNRGFIRELGITIPNNLEPDDWSIYYFCAPTDIEWSIAVRSAIRMLARGRYWQRDDRENSIKSAQQIGREIEMSLNRCDMSEIADAIKYLADNFQAAQVTQTNNNNCGCGGGGGGGGGLFDEPPTQDETIPVDMVPPAPGTDETAESRQAVCSVAHYLADAWVNNFVDIEEIWGGVAVGINALATWLKEKFPAGSIIPFVAMVLTSLAVALETALLAGLANNMANAASSMRDDLVCAIASARTPAEAKKNFESVIASSRAQYGKITYTVLILVAQMLDWDKIMNGEVIVPSEYDDADCSSCGLPEGILSFPVNAGSYAAINGGTAQFLGNSLVRIVGTAVNQGATVMPDLTEFGHTWNKDNGSWSRGYEIELVEKTGANAGAIWIQSGTGVFHETLNTVAVGELIRGGRAEVQSWINEGDTIIAHNTFVSRPNFRFVMASGSGSFTYTFRLRVLTTPDSAT